MLEMPFEHKFILHHNRFGEYKNEYNFVDFKDFSAGYMLDDLTSKFEKENWLIKIYLRWLRTPKLNSV